MQDYPDNNDEQLHDDPSKSAVKRQMHALQDLGKLLSELNDTQLAQLPIEDEKLLEALRETRRIRSKNALKRHLGYVGKLMRNVDPEPIETALEAMHRPTREANVLFHQLEQLRDDVLAAGPAGVEALLARWPAADRQHLRQLLLQHQREQARGKPPAASRKLFRYLRELMETYGSAG